MDCAQKGIVGFADGGDVVGNEHRAGKFSSSGGTTSGEYTYAVTNGEATITAFPSSFSGEVVIPSTLGGYPVTVIGDSAFRSCNKITSVTIPDSVTYISPYAFCNCTNLTSVTIEGDTTTIGAYAFIDCTALASVTLPDSTIDIYEAAFQRTALYDTASNWVNGALYIGNHLIQVKTPLSDDFSIRKGTITIAAMAFSNVSSLTTLTIPEGVTSIGANAFHTCIFLTSVTLPDSMLRIGDGAFLLVTRLLR